MSAGRPVAAFLRGLNVGGHRVTMDRLREGFREIGFADAKTFIASGNMVFDSGDRDLHDVEAAVEEGLRARLGYAVATFARTAEEVRSLAGAADFAGPERGPDDRIHVIFLKERPPKGLADRLLEIVPGGDAFTVHDRDLLWLRRGKLSDLKLRGSDPVQAVSRLASTMRSLNTVQRMAVTFFDLPPPPPVRS